MWKDEPIKIFCWNGCLQGTSGSSSKKLRIKWKKCWNYIRERCCIHYKLCDLNLEIIYYNYVCVS